MEMLLIYILNYWKEHLSSYGKGQLSMKNSVKAFHGGDEYVAILYEVEPKDPFLRRYLRRYSYERNRCPAFQTLKK
jgi:hypothetical protein